MPLATLSPLLCPGDLPSLSGNIYCIGRNYADHVKELNNQMPSEPVVFLKAPSALRPFAQGPLAFPEEVFHHELEIVMLLGNSIPLGAQGSRTAIAGLSLGLDLTRRGLQDELKKKGLPWTTAKSFAGAALLHPFAPLDPLLDLSKIDLQLFVEGEKRQDGSSAQMMFSFEHILSYLATLQPLGPGDIIYTGTPAGVGPLKKGQSLKIFSQALGINAMGLL